MVEASKTASRLSPTTARAVVAGGIVAVALALTGAVVFLGGDDDRIEAGAATTRSTTSTSTSTSTSTTTTAVPVPVGPVSPLTGLPLAAGADPNRPALAVKIDNLDTPRESALPQTGLPKADVVFEEIVEGNITRLVAVYQSQLPGRVGPVRSARTTDVHLLPQLGRVLLAWSGGNGGVIGAVRGSGAIIDVGHDAASGAYSRDRGRRAPHNLYVQTDDLWGRAAGVGAPPALFRYRAAGQANPPTAKPAKGVRIEWGAGAASSPVAWTWDPVSGRYLRDQNGRPHTDADGTRLSAANVVVLATDYGRSAADTRSPEAMTVGRGEAFVYTNGTIVHGTWDRPSEDRPASLVDDAGQPILLTPGQTWVELPRPGGFATVAP